MVVIEVKYRPSIRTRSPPKSTRLIWRAYLCREFSHQKETYSEDILAWPEARSYELKQELKATKKKPTGCLLGACSGQHPMGYRFSLLTLLFSGVITMIKLQNPMKFRLIL